MVLTPDGEIVAEVVVDGAGRIRINLEVVAELQRRCSTLHAGAIRLEVDAPRFVGDQRPFVVMKWCVAVDVQYR